MLYKKKLADETITFNKDSIDKGLHSVLSIYGYYASLIECTNFFSSNRNRFPFITTNTLCNNIYVGKFIIPRGSLYMVNSYNEVVSNRLIYTGEFKYINKNEDFNVKELWKEK